MCENYFGYKVDGLEKVYRKKRKIKNELQDWEAKNIYEDLVKQGHTFRMTSLERGGFLQLNFGREHFDTSNCWTTEGHFDDETTDFIFEFYALASNVAWKKGGSPPDWDTVMNMYDEGILFDTRDGGCEIVWNFDNSSDGSSGSEE